MKCFVVCMGGNGSMVLESLIHMCALGVMEMDELHALMIDVDAGNGNLTRTGDLFRCYQKAFAMLADERRAGGYFSTKIKLYQWTPMHLDATEHNTLRGMISDNREADWLSRLFYTPAELEHSIPIGFKGHPNIGAMFMEDMFEQHGRDESVTSFVNAFETSDENKIMFIGSCFGGTGAAGLPSLKRNLQTRMTKKAKTAIFGSLILLPFFDLPEPATGERLAVSSNVFRDKVKTVLKYYMDQEFKEDMSRSLYQHVYLLGSPRRIHYSENEPGKNLQQNPANLITWFACTAVKQFFTDEKQYSASQLHIAWMNEGELNWDVFSKDVFPQMEQRCAGMMQIALLYITKLSKDLQKLKDKPTPLMETLKRGLGAQAQETLYQQINDCVEYFSYFISFLYQVATHLPIDESLQFPQGTKELNGSVNEYLSFHGTTLENITKALEKDKNGPAAEKMLRSIVFQKMMNAYILCKMEHDKLDCWPSEDDELEDSTPYMVLRTIRMLWKPSREIQNMPKAITSVPLVSIIKHVTRTDFLPDKVSMNDLIAYVLMEGFPESASPEEIARQLFGGLFRAVQQWQ